ncbi:amidohydrolase family protein [Chloroflexota bacterium]
MVEEKNIIAITGGKLIDGTGAAPIEKATVIIEGSKIKAAGKDVPVPKDARVIDAAGKVVMPGMIDSHMHHMGSKTGGPDPNRPAALTLIKSISDSKNLLAAGFTTLKDCGGNNGLNLRKAAADGTLTGLPRILSSVFMLCQTGGNVDNPNVPQGYADARVSGGIGLLCDGVDECIKATRYALRSGADFIKAFVSGNFYSGNSKPTYVEFNLEELTAVVQAAAQMGKFVTVHCQNATSAKNAILAGVKTIDHASRTDDECVELAKKNGAIFVSTLIFILPALDGSGRWPPNAVASFQEEWDESVAAYKRIQKGGALLAIGTDCTGDPPEKGAIELELLVKYCDFTPMEAIVAATRNGAMACFMGDKTGTIEPGKFADIIVVDGDPLADIKVLQDTEKIKMVMLEGNIEVDKGL